jgi:hypothetical protein
VTNVVFLRESPRMTARGYLGTLREAGHRLMWLRKFPGPTGADRGCGRFGSGASSATGKTRRTPTTNASKLKEIFGEDGREWRLNFELEARSLKVTFAGGIETTRTRSIKYDGGIIEPRPRGADWVMIDDSSDMFTEWAFTFAGGIETTRTRSIKYDGGIIEPRPRGADWVMIDDSSDMFTEWARPARPAEPLITRKEWRARPARPAELAARVEGDE